MRRNSGYSKRLATFPSRAQKRITSGMAEPSSGRKWPRRSDLDTNESVAGGGLSRWSTSCNSDPHRRHRNLRPTTLYRFFDPAGVLLYVGISHRAVMRWGDHGRVRPWWPEVASITVEHFADRKAARAAEVKAIQTESPR